MKHILVHAAVIGSMILLFAWPSLELAALLADLGVFGTCREGNCAYGALFIGAPLIWAALSGLGIALWVRWWRRRSRRTQHI